MHDRLLLLGKPQMIAPDPHIALAAVQSGNGHKKTLCKAKISSAPNDLRRFWFVLAVERGFQIFERMRGVTAMA